MNLNTIISK